MKRLAIRNYMRFLINELSELPEGTFKDEDTSIFDVNEIINLAQQTVYLNLIRIIPEEFRQSFYISLEEDKDEYNIVTDCLTTDFWRMEDIYHNETGKRPDGLLHVDLDQLVDIGIVVGEKGVNPKCWFWAARETVGIRPIPSSAVADRLKAYYFYAIPDLNHDSSDAKTEVTDTTIAFFLTAKKITDTNNGLAGFLTGDKIEITGSVSNDGIYTVATGGVAGEIVIEEDLVDESAGASVTIAAINVTTPLLPTVTHKLIAIDGVKQLQIANEEGALEVMEIYRREEDNALNLLGYKPSFVDDRRTSIRERTR